MTLVRTAAQTLALVALAALPACGKSTSTDPTTTSASASTAAGGITGSCNVRKEASTCSEDTEKSDPMGLSKSLCSALKGVWSPGKCPQDAVVGTCSDKDGSTTYYYSDGDAPRDLDSAKSSCEILNEGKFTAIAKPPAAASATAATATATPRPATPTKPAPTPKKH
jgi:hypothetical protein